VKKFITILLFSLHCQFVLAESYRLIVPYSPGGPADIVGRALQDLMSDSTKLVIENKPGASGEIAHHFVATNNTELLMLVGPSIITNSFTGTRHFDLSKDLKPVAYLGHQPLILVTGKDSGIRSLQDLSQTRPRSLTFGSSGYNTITHLMGESLATAMRLDLTHVPFKGVNESVQYILSNQIHFAFLSAQMARPLIESGQLIALAATSNQRLPELSRIPTFAELGYPNFGFQMWHVLMANSQVTDQQILKLQKILRDIMEDSSKSKTLRDRTGLEFDSKKLIQVNHLLLQDTNKYQEFYTKK
jgi:tripartite-type tricarboxylate transporter receptor subunit TctC